MVVLRLTVHGAKQPQNSPHGWDRKTGNPNPTSNPTPNPNPNPRSWERQGAEGAQGGGGRAAAGERARQLACWMAAAG